jgi:phospholipase C
MKPRYSLGLALLAGVNSLMLGGCVGLRSEPPAPAPSGNLQSLNHIVIFAQENRSLDHYFGAMRQYWAQNGITDQSFDGLPQFNPVSGIAPLQAPAPAIPGCDPALSTSTDCVASTSDTVDMVTSFHMASVCNEEQSPFWNEVHVDWDLNDPIGTNPATLNGFVQSAANDARQSTPQLNDINGLRAMGYFDGGDLNYYYFMASNFATSDRWFSPTMDRTQLNRMYLLAATSAGHAYPLAPPYSALANTTIFEELQNAGVTWKIYVDPDGTNCAATDSACLAGFSYINMFAYEQTILATPALLQNIVPISQFTTDVQNGTLPQVALIEPASSAGLDEHPNDIDTSSPINIQGGASYASGLINAFMASPNWKDSAMIFTYDEAGGYYDHVSPQPATPPDSSSSPTYLPIDLQAGDVCDASGQLGTGTCNFAYTGYRVPLIVISPFAKKNYVSHAVYDYTAILALIEKRFSVPALTNRDAAQADMSIDFFDFVNVPWATPPSPPAQVTTGQCTLAAPAL